MSTPPFVHLHCHSHYSLLDGAGTLDRLIERAKTLGMNALALTDHGNLFGALEFYRKAKAAEIKPILGYEAYVAPGSRLHKEAGSMKEASYHLTLLAQNETGFRNLLKLASSAFLEGFYFRPRIDKDLLKAHSEGIICLSGCVSSELNRAIVGASEPDLDKAMATATWFRELFGDRYYIEIQDNGLEIQRIALEGSVEVARRLGIPLVATSDVHYVQREDSEAQDILLCVNTGKFRTDAKRMRMETNEFYLRSPEEMYTAFPQYEEAVRQSQAIADSVQIDLDIGTRHFPIFTPPDGQSSEDYLRQLCLDGLKKRYANIPKRWSNGELSQEVMDRLNRELGVINKLGFPNYFLIVWDYVHYARSRGIEATARGSGIGSLVAYALEMGHVCPLEYDLLFERFLDVNRVEAPDIDIDFDQQRRGEVIQYVKDKYGSANVAQIGTFGTMAARAAIRDVGRALGLPIPRVNEVVSKVPEELHITIQKALGQSDELKKIYDGDPEIRELLDLAMKIEGLARNVGTHAAAVVIADRPLNEYLPLQRVTGKEEVITQWAMADVEATGLLKMDFLGLRNLTILTKVVDLIEQTTGKRINPYEFPLDDAETYALLCRGDTKGVFQLESGGIRDLLQRMKPSRFHDIIATNALYRPGPLEGGMVDDYIEVKHGRKEAEYKHPVMKDVLEETNGVMCIHEETRIALADGSEKPIREVRRGDRVPALNLDSHRFEFKECHGCGPTRRGEGIEITLANGFRVTLTPDHKVFTFDGFKEAQHLDPERDLVAVGLKVPHEKPTAAGLAPWLGSDEDVAYFLGQLVGDGCLTGKGLAVAQEAEERLDHWLETLGLKVPTSQKRVPEQIFRSPPSVRRAFLAGLVGSGDAATDVSDGVLASTSETLRQDVRRLCQLEGIAVSLRPGRIHVSGARRVPMAVLSGSQTGTRRVPDTDDGLVVKSSTAAKAGIDLGDVRYFRIAKLARVTDQQFYGMSVADHHNLLANGIVVKNCYQEQVMRILNRLGGIELANAYKCIKAISKKKLPIIAKFREQFLEGSQAQGLAKDEAEELFGLIEKFAGYGFNKCVVAETEIIHALTGERTTVGELFHSKRRFIIHALGEDGKLHPRRVTDVVWNGRNRVYKLTTRQGKTLVATANHPLRTLSGWTNLGDLKPGDRIAAPRSLRVHRGRTLPRHEIIALAGLLSEGNTCHPTCLYFFNNNPLLIEDFASAAEQFPDSVAAISQRHDSSRREVCVSTGRDTRFRSGNVPWNAGGAATALAEPVAPTRSGMHRWASRLGILNRRAAEKQIPDVCFTLCDADLELFLGRLWAGDGFVGSPGQMPYYATSSAQLARDVQTLLLRFGIVSGVHEKRFRGHFHQEPREYRGFTVHLVGCDSVEAFMERIAPHALGREREVSSFRQYLESRTIDKTSKDTIPTEIRDWVDRERQARGLTWRELEALSHVSMREFATRNSMKKRGFRRSTVLKLARFFGSTKLRHAANSDLFWDTVASIEPQGIEDTYDLTVEVDHNFIADGLVVHNSHSTAYALIAYMTAYLKAHYPVEFMAALLCSDMAGRNFTKKDSLVEHIEDCQRMKIEVVPPNVNCSEPEFAVANGNIYFGLAAIKGCGGSAAEAISAVRKSDGPFRSIFDLCERIDPGTLNRTALESLIKAGALDSLHPHRAPQFQILDRAMQAGHSAAADRRSGQKGLFGEDEEEETPGKKSGAQLPDVPEWEEREKLAKEKEVLGFYLTSHPLAEHQETLATYCSHTSTEAATLKHRTEVMLGGMLAAIKFSHTKNPKPGAPSRYAMFDLEDIDGIMRCIIWPDTFVTYGHLVQPDAILVVLGAIDKRPGSEDANLIVNELISLEELESRFTRGVMIRLLETQHGERVLEQLYEILRGYPGNGELQLLLCLADGARVPMACPKFRIEVNREMRSRVEELLGPGNFRLLAAPLKSNGRGSGNGQRHGNGRGH